MSKPLSDAEIRLERYAQEEKQRKILVPMPDALYRQLRIRAAHEATSMNALVRRLITEAVK